jgi:methylaspartate mutase sigma subunit
MPEERKAFRVVLGVIGADVHIVGARVMEYALREHGYEVISLGIQVPQSEFVDAAIEADADAILVSSVYGHGEIDCRGMREACIERGLADIPLFLGGNVVIGRKDWAETEAIFKGYGFDYVYPPGTDPEVSIADLTQYLSARRRAHA